MRCNLFKPIGSGDAHVGEFLMFSQYTEDITKEQSMKSGYRVIPSKFVALNLNIDRAFNGIYKEPDDPNYRDPEDIHVSSPIQYDDNSGKYFMEIGEDNTTHDPIIVEGCNNIISQIFQSYFENANSYIRNHIGEESFHITNWDIEGRSYASELLWRTLEEWGFIHKETNEAGYEYYDELMYIGDINIHSNHKVGSYSYDEVFCHIPVNENTYYYRLNQSIEIEGIPYADGGGDLNAPLEGWTSATYPINNPVANRAITYHEQNYELGYYYRVGGDFPELEFKGKIDPEDFTPTPRYPVPNNNEYNFNAIIVFYDVLYSEPGEEPRYLYKGRPMGIYLSGAVEDDANGLANTFTKFISNNDAYGQGASFGLRIMMRYTPTPNNSTYAMEVAAGGHDYETITEAMGGIADAIVDINRTYEDRHNMYQAYKEHLAQFRNRRANVPYVREVSGVPYWFVNGRNTGQPVYPTGYEPRTDYTPQEIINSITENPQGSAEVIIVEE